MRRVRAVVGFGMLLAGWTGAPGPAPAADADAAPPAGRNIVFILVDDQPFDAMSLMGLPFLETPSVKAT